MLTAGGAYSTFSIEMVN